MKIPTITAILLAPFLSLVSHGKAKAKQPNIIFILSDDQGYGDLSAHGHPLLKTPHLDQMRKDSVAFDNFYVSPSCSPTRAALLTGMHEFRNGVTHTIQPREHLHKDATLLPGILHDAGYATGFIGKWHLGNSKGYRPETRGFSWASTNNGGPLKHFDTGVIRNGKRYETKGFREDNFFDEAFLFIEESQKEKKPFFCYLATYSPHTPLDAPEEFIKPFRGKVTEEQALYLAMIANIDYNMGRLFEYLEKNNLDEDTIVVYMNDNGVTVGLDVYNANMRGSKCTIWQGGSRAMSFWKWKGTWEPKVSEELTAHLDVLPTLCHYAKAPVPENVKEKLEGYSLVPLLEAKETEQWPSNRLLFQHVARWPSGLAEFHKYAMGGVRQHHYLLLQSRPCDNPECKKCSSQCTTLRNVIKGNKHATYTLTNAAYHWGVSESNGWELYNVKNDPGCKTNIAKEKPELVDQLSKEYDKWWDSVLPDILEKGGDKGEPILLGANRKK